MVDRLLVWELATPGEESRWVGELRRERGGASFRYADGWRSSGYPISISMPLREEPYRERAARFFGNLLPEGAFRQRVCERLQISVDNDFGLLVALGGECAGALSLLPAGVEPSTEPAPYEVLKDADLERLLDRDDGVPLLAGGRTTRMSLAGAHDKVPVFVHDGVLHLPLKHAPSTHIVKVASPHWKHASENELLVSWFAAEVGLEVPSMRLLAPHSALLVERFDRIREEPWVVRRLHQEDLCQATGRPASLKYEQEGGPSLAECVQVVREHTREPLVDVRRVLRWTLFHVLSGNADAHAKNLSFLYDQGPPRLAPFYDLVCTRAYPRLASDLAMRLGGQADPARVQLRHLDELSRELGVGRRLLRNLAGEFATAGEAALTRTTERFAQAYGDHPVLELVPPVIRKQLRIIERWRPDA